MYNVFSYDRQMAQTQNFESMKERFLKDELLRRKTQSKLSNNYKKRVENFVLQMVEKPVLNHEFIPAVVKIRDEEPSKFLGGPSLAIRSFKHEKDRIKENIEQYKQSQSDYTSTAFEFRKRDLSREIQPMMRFTSKTNFERVANRLKVLMQNPNQDARALAKGTENLSDSFILELSKSPEATNKFLAKHLLPELNAKTHFKATHSLYLALPDSLLDKNVAAKQKLEKGRRYKESNDSSVRGHGSAPKLRASSDLDLSEIPHSKNSKESLPPIKHVTMSTKIDEEERQTKENEKPPHIHADTINPADVSKKVLVNCNIIKPKRDGIKALTKGAGHLMSMSERNLKQVYEDLYKSSYHH